MAERMRSPFPYHWRATHNVMPVGMNYLSDLVIRPGIEKRLWPLCLYRGNVSPGRAHRYWNVALLMMAAECETLADGLKVVHNPNFAQLCGTVKPPQKMTLNSFFGRLYDNPGTTDNIPGLTAYVKSLQLGPSLLIPVEHETQEQFCAPWRVSLHEDFDKYAIKPESGIKNLYYPYLAHAPENKDDGQALVLLANELVPAFLPDQIRADACQDLIVSLLSGDIAAGSAHSHVIEYVRKVYKQYPHLYEQGKFKMSFNQPVPGTDGMSWSEVI